MDPVPAAIGLRGATSLFGGMAARSQAKGQQEQARKNAYVARTRALQTDTNERRGLNDELASIRATLAANGQAPGVGTLDIMRELRETRGRERRVAVGSQMQQMYDFQQQDQNAGAAAPRALFNGVAGAANSMFNIQHYYKKKAEWENDG